MVDEMPKPSNVKMSFYGFFCSLFSMAMQQFTRRYDMIMCIFYPIYWDSLSKACFYPPELHSHLIALASHLPIFKYDEFWIWNIWTTISTSMSCSLFSMAMLRFKRWYNMIMCISYPIYWDSFSKAFFMRSISGG